MNVYQTGSRLSKPTLIAGVWMMEVYSENRVVITHRNYLFMWNVFYCKLNPYHDKRWQKILLEKCVFCLFFYVLQLSSAGFPHLLDIFEKVTAYIAHQQSLPLCSPGEKENWVCLRWVCSLSMLTLNVSNFKKKVNEISTKHVTG